MLVKRGDGKSRHITGHVSLLLAALEGINVPSADGGFLLLIDSKAVRNGIIGMDGSKMGGHVVQPNPGCAQGAIHRSVDAGVGLGCR